MWILKNTEDLLETLSSRSQCFCNSIKTFDFFTLFRTIPHAQLKHWSSVASQRIDNTFVQFVVPVFQQTISISMSTNCAPRLPVHWFSRQLSCWCNNFSIRLRCSWVEVVATKILRWSPGTGWPLRNIHFSNGNGSFPFYVFFSFLYHRIRPCVTRRMSYKKQALHTVLEHTGPLPRIFSWSVLFVLLVLCVVFFVLFVFVLCRVSKISRVSGSILDCYFRFHQRLFTKMDLQYVFSSC